MGAVVPKEDVAAVQLQRAARGVLARGDALARVAEVGGPRAGELASEVERILGVRERSFRRKQKDWRTRDGASGFSDTRGGVTGKKVASARSSRRAGAKSTKAVVEPKPKTAAASQKSIDRTAKLIRGGLRPMHGEITLSGVEHSNEAKATLLSSSVGEGTKATYATALGSWTLWRRARGEPLLLHPDRPGE